MRKLLLVLFLILSAYLQTIAQKQLTKEEILRYWTIEKMPTYGNPSIWLTYDKKSDLYAHSFVDSLRNTGIDSVIVYSVSTPVSFVVSDCYDAIPVRTHII